jgi:hypothetical protein
LREIRLPDNTVVKKLQQDKVLKSRFPCGFLDHSIPESLCSMNRRYLCC